MQYTKRGFNKSTDDSRTELNIEVSKMYNMNLEETV